MAARPSWSSLLFTCLVHTLSGVHTQTFALVDYHISGMLAFALSLSHGNEMNVWREAMRNVLKRKLKLRRGTLSGEAAAFKDLVITTCLGNDPCELSTALYLCGPGDWRIQSEWTFFVTDDHDSNESVSALLCDVLVPLLAGSAYELFPRHRWNRHDVAMSRLGILANAHNLLEDCYVEYLCIGHGLRLHSTGVVGEDVPNMLALEWFPPEAHVQSNGGGDAGNMASVAGNTCDDLAAQSWAEVNRRNRGSALRWVQEKPGVDMLFIRSALSPMAQYMKDQIYSSGDIYDTVQNARVLKVPCADGPQALLAGRDWPMLEAALGVADNQAMRSLEELHDPKKYAAYPEQALTVQFRHSIVRMISRGRVQSTRSS